MIYWSEFSWEAFASLTTGLVAVVGAIWVGFRQTKILKRQIDLQAQSLQSDLFDKRFRVYERIRTCIVYARTHSQPVPDDLMQDYFEAMGESRFLFDSRVFNHLDLVYGRIQEFDGAAMTLGDKILSGSLEEQESARQAVNEYHVEFAKELANFPELFGKLRIRVGEAS